MQTGRHTASFPTLLRSLNAFRIRSSGDHSQPSLPHLPAQPGSLNLCPLLPSVHQANTLSAHLQTLSRSDSLQAAPSDPSFLLTPMGPYTSTCHPTCARVSLHFLMNKLPEGKGTTSLSYEAQWPGQPDSRHSGDKRVAGCLLTW